MSAPPADLELFTAKQVADLTKFTTQTVWKKCREREWPHLEYGRQVRFTAEDIREIQDLLRPKRIARSPKKREALR